MIKTITLDASVEEIVNGKNVDELHYDIETVHMTGDGIGIKLSCILKAFAINSHALIMCGNNIYDLINKTMQKSKIPCTIVETNVKGVSNIILVDEKEASHPLDQIKNKTHISNEQLQLFSSVIEAQIHMNDVIAFAYNGSDIDPLIMSQFYAMLYHQSEVRICDLHPNYWKMMELMPSNVLLVDEMQCLTFLHKERLPLSQMIELIQDTITPLAKIVIYIMQYNDLLIFAEGNIYRVVCSIKNKNQRIFKEALISGIIKCYVEDGDLRTLSEQCMCMSVVTSMHEGLYIPAMETIEALKEKVSVYCL